MSLTKDSYDVDPDLVQVLDYNGNLLPDAEIPESLNDEDLVSMYRDLKRGRIFNEKALATQRKGAENGGISTYAPGNGHEGAQVASIYSIEEDDMIFPTYRSNAADMTHGKSMDATLAMLAGYEEGNTDENVNAFPQAIPIATQIPHAVGWSWAAKLKDEDNVALAYFGDGATSEGDFHEGLNFAGVFDTPTVFFCENNHYAISIPDSKQTASPTIAQKAIAYGFEGIRVDGMDPLAVYQVTKDAVDNARNPQEGKLRPTLIEADLYRFKPHTTSDEDLYRRADEISEWREKDPIPRMESFLRDQGLLDDRLNAEIEIAAREEANAAADTLDELETDPHNMFRHVYAEMTGKLEEQGQYLDDLHELYDDN